ncbi:uncharacterized protein B0I36DRAFT_353362 [Microdochium trichocladiopsis]|uniref:Uncharacterized protein n=1 Tax=Microdochium trichocladiopsis TaxID=1682393 RepID=A0A9P8XYL8_9PEZI|nr:uncharacterized protein B0I36DRAFT_353362 [Microdochium trichocladiopsis]KAH7025218.1 hypothetical protein B0I36DRAFT_353362 [Microdochium trichocladiopsis]
MVVIKSCPVALDWDIRLDEVIPRDQEHSQLQLRSLQWSPEYDSELWDMEGLRRLRLVLASEAFIAPDQPEKSNPAWLTRNASSLLLGQTSWSWIPACGDPDFSSTVREAVIDRRATQPIDFVEVQYRPSTRSPRAIDDVNSEKGKDKLSITDIDVE